MDSFQRSNGEQGFSIRGAATRTGNVRREDEFEHRRPSPPSSPRRERSPPPPRRERSPRERHERDRSPLPRRDRSPPPPARDRDRFHDVDAPPRGGARDYRRRRDDDNYRPARDRPSRDSNPRQRSSDKRGDASSSSFYHDNMDYDEPVEPPPANGEKDVATDGQQWRVLLIRGLKLTVDEGLLAKGLEKLYLDENAPPLSTTVPPAVPPLSRPPPPPGASPLSLKRVLLIRDRVSDRSLGYGFAEYHTTADAVAAVAKAKQLGTSCTISSKQIEVCHPHLGVFSPVLSRSRDEQKWVFDFNDQPRTYFDTRYFASPYIVNEHPPAAPADESPSKDATNKPKKRTKTEAMGTLDKPAEPNKKKAKKESGMVALLNRNQAQARGEDVEGEAKNDTESSHPKSSSANPSSSGPDVNAATGTGYQQSFAFDGEAQPGQRLTCCFLCSAKFQSRETLERHVQESQKHAENYKNDETFAKGLANMKKRNVAEDATLKVEMKVATKPEPEKQEPSEYVDRAAKRRAEEAKQKAAGSFQTVSLKDAARKGKGQQGSSNTAPESQAAPISFGIGRNLLQKAGWQEGQALGTGSGITAPIEQNMYAAGVGLGHQSSKQGDAVEEAQRQTMGDRGGFVEKTKDAARSRFESMNQERE